MYRNSLFVLIAGVLAAACGGGEQGGSDTSVQGVTDTEIIIGSHTDLSGPVALLGVDATNGSRMRFDEANGAGGMHGRQIRFVVEDSQYQLPKSIQATNKLINRDKIFLMLHAMGTPMNNATMQTMFDAGVPNVFPVSGGRQMVEPFHPLKFTARGIYYDEIRAGVRYFVEERGAENVCVMYQDTDYGLEIYEGVNDQLAAMSMALAGESAHKPTDTEFTAAVLRMRNAECDVIMMGTIYRDTLLIFEAARKMGWDDVDFVGQNASVSRAIATAQSGAAEGYYAFCHIAPLSLDDDLKPFDREFLERYVDRFGMTPDYAAIEGYRNADIVVQALEKAGPDLTVDAFVAALESMADHEDMFGYRLTFGPDDHKGVDESVLLQVQDGRWVKLDESITY